MSRKTQTASTSEARARLLATAVRIFYTEGIHSVGVDRIIEESQVTRATLYRHFSGKEALVLAYLEQADQGIRAQLTAAQKDARTPGDKVRAVGRAIAEGIRSEGFRGCAFLNAVAEYPDPVHPIHQAVLVHRDWFLKTVTELLAHVGETPAEAAARHFVMLRDGAMAAGCLSDPGHVTETFLEGVEGILQARSAGQAAG
ncbi:TetR/AcrR family transcriptional regulator [Streptomyces globisporus]|uniref:TetR/AcrR family transcriptional regulator n=1 Tax=Streptomyces globisporus TaxID=1908 RepID=UPI00368D26A6